MKKVQFVIVEWADAWADGTDTIGLNDQDLKHKAMIMETGGWLLRDDAEGVSLFNERCIDPGDDSYRSRTFIPRALIRSVTPYTLSKPRTEKVKPEAP